MGTKVDKLSQENYLCRLQDYDAMYERRKIAFSLFLGAQMA